MPAPTVIRSTAGFRSLVMYELSTSGSWLGLPLGAATLATYSTYPVSGSNIASGSTAVSLAAGTAVSGSVAYYGAVVSGVKVLTINDPAPRIIPHTGDDGVITLQVLPALEPASAELRVDKTNDTVDAIAGNIKKFTVGQANLFGQATNMRGFELTVGMLAYSFGQDSDTTSSNFGTTTWDFRILPKATVYQRDTGYAAEANERMYTVAPMYVTSHLWGVQFVTGTEGFTRAQIIRGVSYYKPVVVGFKGDGSTAGFPFDTALPAQAAAKIATWKNGTLQTVGPLYSASVYGISFSTAPLATDIITCFYETP